MRLTREQLESCLDPREEPSEYLSIVIVTRVDNYAGGQHHRLQNFIDSAYILAEKTQENIELLIIEWNPPNDKRRVIDAFRFRSSKYLKYRIITIPNSLHQIMQNRGNSPLHEFEGKNVGIRFARGQFIVCTNQDDIWSHNFHNAIKSRVFKKDVIYLQHQDHHNIHDNLPPSIVNLEAFPKDETIYNSCKLGEQDWGNYTLPPPIKVTASNEIKDKTKTMNILEVADQAGDFTLAHRDTWKIPRGYREAGGVAWMDIEFICTAAWTKDIPIVYVKPGFTCHQEHANIWENNKDAINDNRNIDMSKIERKEKIYMNKDGEWALQNYDIYEHKLECIEFQGGLVW
ncbi:uncharacterized protein BX663DRAFT_439783 [Cokeromyces recurvatus]|uniref:uncharacterized protein n=1 Tax=Cokeromyces recurvatus TaxID=90255 RepID=UPI00221EA7C6|nr:uncharacterized protein BX663DRAFT_439783 [Cokeromyces recurvatus]KAI7900223.1 hypothetical protein BX663DRAFT_439783 [Cokeromyces recurvatus]